MKKRTAQAGFSHTMILMSLVLLALIGFAGYRIMNNKPKTVPAESTSAAPVAQLPAKISTKPQAQQAAKALDKEAIDTSLGSKQLDNDLNSVL